MLLKVFALLLFIGSSLATLPLRPKISVDQSLANFMLQPRGLSGSAAQNQYCFNRYLPILKEIADQYETDYNACVSEYENDIYGINKLYSIALENITARAGLTCQALENCSAIGDNLGENFDCYEINGSEQSKELYSISSIAGENSKKIKLEYQIAESVADLCAGTAERDYTENTANTYSELSRCLDGDIITSTSTSSPTTLPQPDSLQ